MKTYYTNNVGYKEGNALVTVYKHSYYQEKQSIYGTIHEEYILMYNTITNVQLHKTQ